MNDKSNTFELNDDFRPWPCANLIINKPLMGDIFLFINQKLLKYRHSGESIDRAFHDKLMVNGITHIYILEADRESFESQFNHYEKEVEIEILDNTDEKTRPLFNESLKLRRSSLDLFSNPKQPQKVKKLVDSSKNFVSQVMTKPHIAGSMQKLQRYGHGTVDHSVNVSMLSVLLGVYMGYSGRHILEHLSIAGLMHDLGKALIHEKFKKKSLVDANDEQLKDHPVVAAEFLERKRHCSREVLLMVRQHHEFLDGSGFPSQLKGVKIYELTRILTIANEFDTLVSELEGEIPERQKNAIAILNSEKYEGKLDRQKLRKATQILKTLL